MTTCTTSTACGEWTNTCSGSRVRGRRDRLRSWDWPVPDQLDQEFHAVLTWACPGLPDPRPDPYERGMTADQVDEFARLGGR
jgi:hypothetical protein